MRNHVLKKNTKGVAGLSLDKKFMGLYEQKHEQKGMEAEWNEVKLSDFVDPAELNHPAISAANVCYPSERARRTLKTI